MESQAQPPQGDFRYWAFISYQPPDFALAKWLFQSLETYGIPRVLAGQPLKHGVVPKRLYPVFLDREELPLADAVGDPIEWALRQSRALIVICSPQSVRSAELERHINFFKSLGHEDRIICLVVDPSHSQGGAPQQSAEPPIPEPAKGALVVDMRKGHDSKSVGKLRVIAQLIGVGFSDLKLRDQQRQHMKMQMIMAGVGVLFTVFTVLMVQLFVEKQRADNALNEAMRQRQEAVRQRQIAIKAQKEAEAAAKAAIEAKRRAEESKASEGAKR